MGCQGTDLGGKIKFSAILGTDQILTMNSKEPYFGPKIGKFIWGDNSYVTMIDKIKFKKKT